MTIITSTSTKRLSLLAALVTLSLFAAPASAFGYSGTAAATWAESHALTYTCGTAYPCLPNDCANFVSHAMNKGGGYPLHLGNGVNEDLHNWFSTRNGLGGLEQSFTWGYANELHYFLLHDSPGGSGFTIANGNSLASLTGLVKGDVLFYDWTNNGTKDHASMQTNRGLDTNWSAVQTGDLVSMHTTDRRRAWWTLSPYNPNRNVTKITLVHISPNN